MSRSSATELRTTAPKPRPRSYSLIPQPEIRRRCDHLFHFCYFTAGSASLLTLALPLRPDASHFANTHSHVQNKRDDWHPLRLCHLPGCGSRPRVRFTQRFNAMLCKRVPVERESQTPRFRSRAPASLHSLPMHSPRTESPHATTYTVEHASGAGSRRTVRYVRASASPLHCLLTSPVRTCSLSRTASSPRPSVAYLHNDFHPASLIAYSSKLKSIALRALAPQCPDCREKLQPQSLEKLKAANRMVYRMYSEIQVHCNHRFGGGSQDQGEGGGDGGDNGGSGDGDGGGMAGGRGGGGNGSIPEDSECDPSDACEWKGK